MEDPGPAPRDAEREEAGKVAVRKDGGYGWVCVGAMCLINLISDGIVMRSFGILFLALNRHYEVPPTTTAWVVTTTIGMAVTFGVLGGYLAERFGTRPVVVFGSLLQASGFFLSAFVTRVEYLYVTIGCFVGISYSCLIIPSMAHVALFFDKNVALAQGIGMAGSGIGSFIGAPLITYLLEYYGMNGTLMLMGVCALHQAVAGMLLRPISSSDFEKVSRRSLDKSIKQNVRETNMNTSSFVRTIPMTFDNLGFKPDDYQSSQNDHRAKGIGVPSSLKRRKSFTDTKWQPDKAITPKQQRKCFWLIWSPTKRLKFVHLTACYTCLFLGYFNMISFLVPVWANEVGIGPKGIVVLLTVYGAADLTGSILICLVADVHILATTRLLAGAVLVAGVAVILVPFIGYGLPRLASLVGVSGFMIGCIPPLQPVITLEKLSAENLPTVLGLIGVVMGIPHFFMEQLAARLQESTGSWSNAYFITGGFFFLGALLLLLLELYSESTDDIPSITMTSKRQSVNPEQQHGNKVANVSQITTVTRL